MMHGFIYRAFNKQNYKLYVGQAIASWALADPLKYLRQRYTRKGAGSNPHWKAALAKYGFDGFSWSILRECEDQQELDEAESDYIDLFLAMTPDRGYNQREGGRRMGHCSTSTKKRMSEAQRLSWNDVSSRKRRLSVMNDPVIKQARIAAQRKAFEREEVKSKRRKSQIEAQNRPEVKAKNIAMLYRTQNDPGVVARKSKAMKGRVCCYNPETKERRLLWEIPTGWCKGLPSKL